jgi:hypothetical protein
MHENRETSETPAAKPGSRAVGEGNSRTAHMYVPEESHDGIVPMNHSNKDRRSLAESEEGRPSIKENAGQPHTYPTHSGKGVPEGLSGGDLRWGFACCLWSPMHTCRRHYPGRFRGACSLVCLNCQRLPLVKQGRLLHLFFRSPLSVPSGYGLHACGVAKRPSYTESSDSFVASPAASIAAGWSEPVPGREFLPPKASAFHSALYDRLTANAKADGLLDSCWLLAFATHCELRTYRRDRHIPNRRARRFRRG